MKTHKIRYGGDFTVDGYDETFTTYCGITEQHSDKLEGHFVSNNDECTCKKCNQAYDKEIKAISKLFCKISVIQ